MHAPFAQPWLPEHVATTTPLQSMTFFRSAEHVDVQLLFPPPLLENRMPPSPPVPDDVPPLPPLPPAPPLPPSESVLVRETLHAATDASPHTVETNNQRNDVLFMMVTLASKQRTLRILSSKESPPFTNSDADESFLRPTCQVL